MIRLIHTADVHLDMCFAGDGISSGFGNRRRQHLRDALERIVQRAGAWPADALLIAGDLFDLDRVTRDTTAFLKQQFASIPEVPVVIAPGNHDPYVGHSPYAMENWPSNVTIFKGPVWERLLLKDGALAVHGFGFDGPDISANPFGALEIEQDDAVHVAVAHGSERSHQPAGKDAYAAFHAQDAAHEALAYLALGHFHAVTPIEGLYSTTMYYSGPPEGHDFKETGVQHYLEIEIDESGARVTPVESSTAVYEQHRIDCTGMNSSQDLIHAIRAISTDHGCARIARITAEGHCPSSLRNQFQAVHDAAQGAFEHLVLVDKTAPAEDYEDLALEETSLGDFVRRINAELNDCAEDGRQRMLLRARELGVAAYRDVELSVQGMEG